MEKTNEINPKFNVGDIVANKLGDAWRIDSLDRKNYQVSDGKGNYNYFPISKQDEMHLWSIEDAKDGDILIWEDGWTCIFKCIHGIWFSSYCFIDCDGVFHEGYEEHEVDATINGRVYPATKEVRNLFLTRMQNAGWSWNVDEKKELKVEPKFHEGDIIIHKELGGDYIHNPHKIIQVDILDKKYRLEGGLVAHFGEQDDYELVEQKTVWSKEDETKINYLIALLQNCTMNNDALRAMNEGIEDWLNSLKDKVQSQLQLKPSDEQMDALLYVVRNYTPDVTERIAWESIKTLELMFKDLKKLREE